MLKAVIEVDMIALRMVVKIADFELNN